MYTVYESRHIDSSKLTHSLQSKYYVWKRIIEVSGPFGLRKIRGFRDEALQGEWFGYRSSRLNRKWRVIYKVDDLNVYVVELNAHKY